MNFKCKSHASFPFSNFGLPSIWSLDQSNGAPRPSSVTWLQKFSDEDTVGPTGTSSQRSCCNMFLTWIILNLKHRLCYTAVPFADKPKSDWQLASSKCNSSNDKSSFVEVQRLGMWWRFSSRETLQSSSFESRVHNFEVINGKSGHFNALAMWTPQIYHMALS